MFHTSPVSQGEYCRCFQKHTLICKKAGSGLSDSAQATVSRNRSVRLEVGSHLEPLLEDLWNLGNLASHVESMRLAFSRAVPEDRQGSKSLFAGIWSACT